MTGAAAGLIFLAAILAIIARPGGLNEAVFAAAGAALMVAVGAVSPAAAVGAIAAEWNVILFFAGMMAATAVAERGGFFAAAGAVAAALGGGSARRLLLAVFAVGGVTTAFLSNDATALILTPIVLVTVRHLRVPPMPYLMATSFVANTASAALPISNPVNLVITDRSHLDFGFYVTHVLPVAAVATALNAAIFLAVYRRQLSGGYEYDWRAALARASADRALFRATTFGLAALAVAFVAGAALAIPLGAVAAAGGAALVAVAAGMRRIGFGYLRQRFSVSLFVYVAGLFVLVAAVDRLGVTRQLVAFAAGAPAGRAEAAVAGCAFTAVASNLVNNFPAALIAVSGLPVLPGALQPAFAAGAILGADLGPNLTPVGSLSTMLWLVAVRRSGYRVSSGTYLRVGLLTGPALLAAALALLALLTHL